MGYSIKEIISRFIYRVKKALVTLLGRLSFIFGEKFMNFLCNIIFKDCQIAQIEGFSMFPTLKSGEFVLVQSGGDYIVGDIVFAQHPKSDYFVVKRLKFLTEIEGKLFAHIEGDNIKDSVDSRQYGPIPIQNIKGRVLL